MAPIAMTCDISWDCGICLAKSCKFAQFALQSYCVDDLKVLSGDGYLVDSPDTPCPPPLPKFDDDTVEGINMGLAVFFFLISTAGLFVVGRRVDLVLSALDLIASSFTYYMELTATRVAQVGVAATSLSRTLASWRRNRRATRLNSSLSSRNSRTSRVFTAPELTVFQELIKKRKAERKRKAEEKHQEGLKRIEEMKSDREMDPLLPKQVWAILLEEDKDITPQKRAMIHNRHPIFSDLLEENKIRDILFPLVLDYKIPFLDQLLRKNYYDPLDMKLVGDLRLVSKEIRESVDKWIECDLLNSMRTLLWRPPTNPVTFTLGKTNLDHVKTISRGNPKLFTRSLEVEFVDFSRKSFANDNIKTAQCQYQDDLISFKDAIAEFLRKVGDQILYFDLSFVELTIERKKEYGLNIIQIYSILRQYLLLMPNLKWMNLTAKVSSPDDPSKQLQSWLANANTGLQAAPIPKMNELERLDISEWRDFPVWDTFLKANSHLKYHTYDRGGIYPISEYERHSDPLVLSLPLEHVNAGRHPWDLTMLQKVADSNWNLKRLQLNTYGFEIDSFFRCLEKFPSLEDLDVDLSHVSIGGNVSFLRLPKLKNLSLNLGAIVDEEWTGNFHFFFSLHFLLYCEKLESLTWIEMLVDGRKIKRKMDELKLDEGMIDFKGGFGELGGINKIWNVFPLLKRVEVSLWEAWEREPSDSDDDDYCYNYDYDYEECKRIYRDRKLVYEQRPDLFVI